MRRPVGIALLLAGITFVATTLWIHREPPLVAPAYEVELVDVTGAPVWDCRASLWQLNEDSRTLYQDSNRSCGQGLVWQGLVPGEYRVMIQAPGAALVDRTFEVAPDQVLDDGQIEAKAGGNVAGTVTWEGAPVAGARVGVGGLGRETVMTGEDGTYVFRGIPVGEYDLRAVSSNPPRAADGKATVVAGERARLDFALKLVPIPGVLGFRGDSTERGLVIGELQPGSSAIDCGLAVGDLLLQVDGTALAGLSRDDQVAAFAGLTGTIASLVVETAGESRTIECERRMPKAP